jgi:serine/threonine protein kinase
METYCGTTGYASPEMLAGRKYLGVETDIWSLGIILYTLLAGGLPFDDDDEGAMKDLILKGEYEEPEWLTEGESAVSWNSKADDRRSLPHPKHAPSRPHSTPLDRIYPYSPMVQIDNSRQDA